MTQDELWELNYHEYLNFMMEQKRRPSKHRLEEHKMLNWLKFQKKQLAQGKMNSQRIKKFNQLLEQADLLRRKNQYAYTNSGQPEEESDSVGRND